jgi:uncharacterized protein (DUF952 family)
MEIIFHIVDRDVWENAKSKGEYQPDSLEREGFIHCSTKSELIGVANRFYNGRANLVLLFIDPLLVKNEIKYEKASDGVAGLFPHIYGALNVEAVTAVVDFPSRADGKFNLPNNVLAERPTAGSTHESG